MTGHRAIDGAGTGEEGSALGVGVAVCWWFVLGGWLILMAVVAMIVIVVVVFEVLVRCSLIFFIFVCVVAVDDVRGHEVMQEARNDLYAKDAG